MKRLSFSASLRSNFETVKNALRDIQSNEDDPEYEISKDDKMGSVSKSSKDSSSDDEIDVFVPNQGSQFLFQQNIKAVWDLTELFILLRAKERNLTDVINYQTMLLGDLQSNNYTQPFQPYKLLCDLANKHKIEPSKLFNKLYLPSFQKNGLHLTLQDLKDIQLLIGTVCRIKSLKNSWQFSAYVQWVL